MFHTQPKTQRSLSVCVIPKGYLHQSGLRHEGFLAYGLRACSRDTCWSAASLSRPAQLVAGYLFPENFVEQGLQCTISEPSFQNPKDLSPKPSTFNLILYPKPGSLAVSLGFRSPKLYRCTASALWKLEAVSDYKQTRFSAFGLWAHQEETVQLGRVKYMCGYVSLHMAIQSIYTYIYIYVCICMCVSVFMVAQACVRLYACMYR